MMFLELLEDNQITKEIVVENEVKDLIESSKEEVKEEQIQNGTLILIINAKLVCFTEGLTFFKN